MKPTLIAAIGLLVLTEISAQDAFRSHFRGNESDFNPAFTGQVGATRVSVDHRSQWNDSGSAGSQAAPYKSQSVTYEEGLPCLFFDYGLFFRTDTEGQGLLRTTEFGGRFALAIPFSLPNGWVFNVRAGLGLSRGQRSIDYSKLTFLDQLDPFYGLMDASGNPNTTGFFPTNGAGSPWYTSSNLGIAIKGGRNTDADRPFTYDVGFAVHNWRGMIGPDSRQTASLLGLDNELGERYVLTGRLNMVVAKKNRRYWSIHPLGAVQVQSGLRFIELGMGISWNRNLELGYYHHFAGRGNSGPSTDWSSIRAEFGGLVFPYSRFDFAVSWSFQYGTLKNYVVAPFELTATYSFGRSISCLASGDGRSNDFVKGNRGATDCYSFSTAANRIYDNIWYRD